MSWVESVEESRTRGKGGRTQVESWMGWDGKSLGESAAASGYGMMRDRWRAEVRAQAWGTREGRIRLSRRGSDETAFLSDRYLLQGGSVHPRRRMVPLRKSATEII